MKKMILAMFLLAIMLLCGCGTGADSIVTNTEPQTTNTPEATLKLTVTTTPAAVETLSPSPKDSNTALIEALSKRVKNNIDTGTFEGFTRESTLQDVVERTDMELHGAKVIYAVDFLGYPANMVCSFYPTLNGLTFFIHPDKRTGYDKKLKDVISKLDDALGSCDKIIPQRNGDWGRYSWKNDTYSVNMLTKEVIFMNHGELAEISVQNLSDSSDIPSIPDIFHYQFGTDFDTVYKNESLSTVPQIGAVANIEYIKDRIVSHFYFGTDESNDILGCGIYEFNVDMPDACSAVDFMDAALGSLQSILGTPEKSEYGYSEDGTVKTAEEMKALGYDDFWLDARWGSIWLFPSYDPNYSVSFSLWFEKDYFKTPSGQ